MDRHVDARTERERARKRTLVSGSVSTKETGAEV